MSTNSRPQSQLFVEGLDDHNVIGHLLAKLRPDWPGIEERNKDFGSVKLNESGNDDGAIKNFVMAAKHQGIYGLVVDADDEDGKRVQDRWRRIVAELSPVIAPNQMPETPPSGGWTISLPDKKLGVWLMPNNQDTGALEAFLIPLVPRDDHLWDYASTVIRTIQENYSPPPFPVRYTSKAKLHTWLAWRKKPGRPYGQAITCGDLDPTLTELSTAFAAWFEQVFSTCLLCEQDGNEYEPGTIHISGYRFYVCQAHSDGNLESWGPHYEETILEHLRQYAIKEPQRITNSDLLPREYPRAV
jgi:hypothetical protein